MPIDDTPRDEGPITRYDMWKPVGVSVDHKPSPDGRWVNWEELSPILEKLRETLEEADSDLAKAGLSSAGWATGGYSRDQAKVGGIIFNLKSKIRAALALLDTEET